jgi:hypothetical protein
MWLFDGLGHDCDLLLALPSVHNNSIIDTQTASQSIEKTQSIIIHSGRQAPSRVPLRAYQTRRQRLHSLSSAAGSRHHEQGLACSDCVSIFSAVLTMAGAV